MDGYDAEGNPSPAELARLQAIADGTFDAWAGVLPRHAQGSQGARWQVGNAFQPPDSRRVHNLPEPEGE